MHTVEKNLQRSLPRPKRSWWGVGGGLLLFAEWQGGWVQPSSEAALPFQPCHGRGHFGDVFSSGVVYSCLFWSQTDTYVKGRVGFVYAGLMAVQWAPHSTLSDRRVTRINSAALT